MSKVNATEKAPPGDKGFRIPGFALRNVTTDKVIEGSLRTKQSKREAAAVTEFVQRAPYVCDDDILL
jgi:hypothetical protein